MVRAGLKHASGLMILARRKGSIVSSRAFSFCYYQLSPMDFRCDTWRQALISLVISEFCNSSLV
jgi:hypothetical protein